MSSSSPPPLPIGNNGVSDGGARTSKSTMNGNAKESSVHDSNQSYSGGTMMDIESSAHASTFDESQKQSKNVIKRAEKAVRNTRLLVALMILSCAVGIALAVYFLAKQSDARSFELEYTGFTSDIVALVRWEVRYNFALMEQLSSNIAIASGYLNSTFPFHTEPQFEITGGFVDGMGGIMSAAYAPLVTEEQREEWERYSVAHQGWIEESAYLKRVHPVHRDALHGTIQDHEHDRRTRRQLQQDDGSDEDEKEVISPVIYRYNETTGEKVPETSEAGKVYAPLWQVSPADVGVVNINLFSDSRVVILYEEMIKGPAGATILSQSTEIGDMFDFLFDPEEKMFKKDPHGLILAPVYKEITEEPTLAGIAIGVTPFGNLLDRLLPEGTDGIIGVFNDNCGDVMSFELTSGKALFLGYQDLHDPEMDQYEVHESNLEMYEHYYMKDGLCPHDLYLYPSSEFVSKYSSSHAGTYASISAIAIALFGIFMIYDTRVTRRQNKTLQSAMRSRAVVNSLFPERIARKMVEESSALVSPHQLLQPRNKKYEDFLSESTRAATKGDKGGYSKSRVSSPSKPLADLFPNATVMFGDLVGFTAWSSLREPHHVFILLETIYSSFDRRASRLGVFKVETIGDCYVAACGLPVVRDDHAETMAIFAAECCCDLPAILRELELELGPDTSSLGIRIGLHSGPVTAGVLRGERARFQLFGDTVNTTSRIESTGEKNKVHISEDTANLLIAAGKANWVYPREDKVSAKGKGELNTFWLRTEDYGTTVLMTVLGGAGKTPKTSSSNSKVGELVAMEDSVNSQDRFVNWVVDILKKPLTDIIQRRAAMDSQSALADHDHIRQAEVDLIKPGQMVVDEVQEVISLPKYDANASHGPGNTGHHSPPDLPPIVLNQLRDYVQTLAGMYRQNPFHNYQHACHVLLSCSKLLSRIVSPDIEDVAAEDNAAARSEAKLLHDHTYGITSDPLTQFSVILSALIHDVDHPGVPNVQLALENDELAIQHKYKSAAEQHSVVTSWDLLMERNYQDLRAAIYSNTEELHRFRQLIVNTVMATDIMDKELGQKRKDRWGKAFSDGTSERDVKEGHPGLKEEFRNRKATIVIEHIIQASDVAHTMQHWHIYKKWNERLFRENYLAYKAGRRAENPLDEWYKGEIDFFDFYIIPLAKKLKECGVFGVSSDEYLSYAVQNRKEWVKKGKRVVEEFAEIVRQEYSP